jgi:hypothetical protein
MKAFLGVELISKFGHETFDNGERIEHWKLYFMEEEEFNKPEKLKLCKGEHFCV